MKRFLPVAAILALGLTLSSPAIAGHRGPYRGHGRIVRGSVGRFVSVGGPAVYFPPRVGASFFFGFGHPAYRYAPVYAPTYVPAPVYYAPAPVIVAPPCRIWIPGHYVWDDGVRLYVQGRWGYRSHRGYGDYDDEDGD